MSSPSIIHGQQPPTSDDDDDNVRHSSDCRPPHAFVLPYPVQGHIKPMMLLCKLLAKHHGFIISFLNTESNHKLIMEDVGPGHGHEDSDGNGHGHGDIRLLWLPDAVLPEDDHGDDDDDEPESHIDKVHITLTKAFLNTNPRALEDLVRAQDPPVSCLILDAVAPRIAHELGAKLGIPRLFFFSASAASLRMMLRSGEVGGAEEKLLSYPLLPSPHVLEPYDINPYLKVCGKPRDYMCRAFNALGREGVLQEGDTILIHTIEEVEAHSLAELRKKEKPSSLKLLPIGPLLDNEGNHDGAHMSLWKTNYSCQAWLDTHPPRSVLLVSFGSLAPLSPSQLTELGLGLEMSGHRILWVIRPDQIVGPDSPLLPDDFFLRNRARISVISWLPQLRVLSHPSLAGFFTHCGWNSTLESISSGVPMLAWPFFGDQMQNARFIVDVWRIGLRLLEPGCSQITRDVVAMKIVQLMDGEIGQCLRQRAQDLKRVVNMAIAPDGSSTKNMLCLTKRLAKRNLK